MGRKKKPAEAPAGDSTIVMMVALMILLLAFFIVLVSMSTIDEKRKTDVLTSVYDTFGAMTGGRSPYYQPGGITSNATAPMDQLAIDFKAIKELAYSETGNDKIQLLSKPGRKTIVLADDIVFTPDQIALRPEIVPFLKGLAEIIKSSPYRVDVAGHTDDITPGPMAPAKDNWTLSALRAMAVVDLMLQQKVPSSRLAVYGYGPMAPIAPNNTPKNRRRNNRVEITMDDRLGSLAEAVKLTTIGGGKLRFKGFSFDLLKQKGAGQEAPQGE